VRADQVTQVRGYADQLLRVKSNPYDPSNRRISILVKNSDNAPPPQLEHVRVVNGAPGPAPSGPAPGAPAPPTPPAATPKPPASTLAKPGMLSKLTGLLPGAKK
jgi:chemotaxis protein MotB